MKTRERQLFRRLRRRALGLQVLMLMLLIGMSQTASAISGNYSDGGGGTYWCNVYVHDIAASKSYGWCTGDSEDGKMNEFRYFWSSSKLFWNPSQS